MFQEAINNYLQSHGYNTINLKVSDEELAKRRAAYQQPAPKATRGVLAKFAKLTDDAAHGCITDF